VQPCLTVGRVVAISEIACRGDQLVLCALPREVIARHAVRRLEEPAADRFRRIDAQLDDRGVEPPEHVLYAVVHVFVRDAPTQGCSPDERAVVADEIRERWRVGRPRTCCHAY
jgi:hypothetical protein